MYNNIKIVACLLGLASGSAFATQENSINGLDASQRGLLADRVKLRVNDALFKSSMAAKKELMHILVSQADKYCEQNNIDRKSFRFNYIGEVLARFNKHIHVRSEVWGDIVERAILHPEEFVQEIIEKDEADKKQDEALRATRSPEEAKIMQELAARAKAIKSK